MNFSIYGGAFGTLSFEELLADGRKSQLLLARAEESGSEGCYCEVAKWSFDRNRWERYCFAKFLGGEGVESEEGLTPRELADRYAAAINATGGWAMALIHNLPTYVADRRKKVKV
jgi:hypothetical protein